MYKQQKSKCIGLDDLLAFAIYNIRNVHIVVDAHEPKQQPKKNEVNKFRLALSVVIPLPTIPAGARKG